jgi:hypothetical protein
MKEFILVNRQKILFSLKGNSIVFTSAWTVYLFKKYFDGITLDFNTIILGYCIATIFFPSFTQLLLSIVALIEFMRINKILNNNPFNHLLNMGLTKSYTDKKRKWITSNPTLTGSLDNYPIRCEVEKGIVRIIANANLDKIGKADMKNWKEIFGEKNVEYDWFGVALVYSPKRFKQINFNDLENEIKQFIKTLKDAKIDAWDINGNV